MKALQQGQNVPLHAGTRGQMGSIRSSHLVYANKHLLVRVNLDRGRASDHPDYLKIVDYEALVLMN